VVVDFRFLANCYGQFMKKCGTMAFYGGNGCLKWQIFGLLPSAIDNTAWFIRV
jgi:hypothetical protein